MSTFESELESAAAELEAEFFAGRESEDGPGQRAAKEQLLTALALASGIDPSTTPNWRSTILERVADAGKLHGADGNRVMVPKKGKQTPSRLEPDLAFTSADGKQRVNIEVDIDPKTARKHIEALQKHDPNARHVALIVDPVTGKLAGGAISEPGKALRPITEREMKALANGRLQSTLIPSPQTQKDPALPKTRAKTPAEIDAAMRKHFPAAVPSKTSRKAPAKAGGAKRRGARESELEDAAAELESELNFSNEQMDVDIPGIPGSNQWFTNPAAARQAAMRDARELGLGYRLAHDPRPSRGQPHYHIVAPDGRRVLGHYFYGSKPPRRVYRGRPNREFETVAI